MKSKCDHGDHIVCNECMKPAGDVAQVHLDSKETMNKPQLSAEMEQVIIDYAYNYKDIAMAQEDLQKLLKEVVSHFLATALEEQRAEMMKKVVELNKKWGAVPNDFRHWHQELVESLNGKE